MKALWIVLGVFLVVFPLLASLIVCAPKWWREKVASHVPAWVSEDVGPIFTKERRGPSIGWIRWVWFLPVMLILIPIYFVVWYFFSLAALVERKCPYTPPGSDRPWQRDCHDGGDMRDFFLSAWEILKGDPL